MDSADKWISPSAFELRIPIDNKSNIPHLAFNFSNAGSVISKNLKFRNKQKNIKKLTFADSTTFCGIHLLLRIPQQQAIFACCGIRNKTNVPINFTLQVYVC